MKMNRPPRHQRLIIMMIAANLAGVSGLAHADEREDLERLRATVLGLVDALVTNGVLPREKVDSMMRAAEVNASARLAQLPAPASALGPDGKKIVRVAAVSEAVKEQLRAQIKTELLAQMNDTRTSTELGERGSRVRVEGDLRVRGEMTRLGKDNTPATAYAANASLTRAPDFLTLGGTGKDLRIANTQEDANRARIRARIGVEADIGNNVTASVGIATGSTTTPTSSNQTLGQNGYFNKYNVALDRAAIRLAPASWLNTTAGRMRNPFFGTDLVWADDLNFDGVSMTLQPQLSASTNAFFSIGWFSLSPSAPKSSHGRSLLGVQTGASWQFGQQDNRLKIAAALYDFRGIEGLAETRQTYQTVPDYVVRSEYGAGYRQRGNTLFRINAPSSVDGSTNWGLASSFRELDFTAALDIAQFDPVHVVVTGDIVKNLGFKINDITQRSGATLVDGKSMGYLAKLQIGDRATLKKGQWNAFLAYRYLGSDAVVDAFTNSDFGLGGTNSKGTMVGASYAVAQNSWVSARWLSSNLIDSAVPATVSTTAPTKFSTDLIQIDLNTRF